MMTATCAPLSVTGTNQTTAMTISGFVAPGMWKRLARWLDVKVGAGLGQGLAGRAVPLPGCAPDTYSFQETVSNSQSRPGPR